jgi:hypothetical protein
MGEMHRRGEVEKCPACGWRLDPGAYRCSKCRIYFCYRCRARVTERESQFQCADQSCECYGKLLCSACVVPIPETLTTQQEVKERDKTATALIAGALVSAVAGGALLFVTGFDSGMLCGIGFWAFVLSIVASTFVLRALGFNVWNSSDKKHVETFTHNMPHFCCMQCRHPVKCLR